MSATEQALVSGDAVPLSLRGPAPKRVVAGYGFWLFLLSDIIIFAALFAAYAVLSGETAGGPTAADLFDKRHVLIETACLLASSVACGFGSLAMQSGDRNSTYFWMAITLILGVTFLSLEVSEFSHMLSIGAGPRSESGTASPLASACSAALIPRSPSAHGAAQRRRPSPRAPRSRRRCATPA